MENQSHLLVKIVPQFQNLKTGNSRLFLDDDIEIEPLDAGTEGPENISNKNIVSESSSWFLASSQDSINTWEEAHEFYERNKDKGVTYVEPDILHDTYIEDVELFGRSKDEYIQAWPPLPKEDEFAWYLNDNRTQLAKARKYLYQDDIKSQIRIAHLDTGYDPDHISIPQNINLNLQKSFVRGEDSNSAVDRMNGGLLRHPGHGTGTLAILAGNKISHPSGFNDYMGSCPFAEVVPIRIGKSVVHFKTSSFAKALKYALNIKCDLISMSMGGMASKLWAERVNEAYDAGLVMVTAAGNNYRGLPIRSLVYPSRFERVISACGITYGNKPYFKKGNDFNVMQGCWGPSHLMEYALSAYTPNVPWATYGSVDSFRKSGGGTSSATPQIAGAAGLLLEKLKSTSFEFPWQKVEVVRQILFATAILRVNSYEHLGNGVVQAFDALQKEMDSPQEKAPEAKVTTRLLGLVFNKNNANLSQSKQEMFEVELLQLSFKDNELKEIISDMEKEDEKGVLKSLEQNKSELSNIREIVKSSPLASHSLKKYL